MGREAWRATVHEVTKSQAQLRDWAQSALWGQAALGAGGSWPLHSLGTQAARSSPEATVYPSTWRHHRTCSTNLQRQWTRLHGRSCSSNGPSVPSTGGESGARLADTALYLNPWLLTGTPASFPPSLTVLQIPMLPLPQEALASLIPKGKLTPSTAFPS